MKNCVFNFCIIIEKYGIEREKFYPGPVLEPMPIVLRASALPLRYPGHVPIQGRINTKYPFINGHSSV